MTNEKSGIERWTFTNKCDFPEDSWGKLVLCGNGNKICLYGDMYPEGRIAERNFDEAKKFIQEYFEFVPVRYGCIVYDGRILGRALAVFKKDRLYVCCHSVRFGPAHPEAIARCLSGAGIQLECEPVDPVFRNKTLDEFLARRGG